MEAVPEPIFRLQGWQKERRPPERVAVVDAAALRVPGGCGRVGAVGAPSVSISPQTPLSRTPLPTRFICSSPTRPGGGTEILWCAAPGVRVEKPNPYSESKKSWQQAGRLSPIVTEQQQQQQPPKKTPERIDAALRRVTCRRIPFKIGQPKKQIVPKTVERDFEREYGKLQQLEEQTKKLQKDMKKSTDADLAMSKAAVKISSDLLANPLCEQDAAFLEMVTAFDTAMRRMDSFNQEKVNQIQKTVIEPLKKFSSVFPSLNMAVKRREQSLQDYRRLQSRVEKYEEKERSGPVLAKLHQAREELRPVKEDFEAKNKQLLEEMPKFYSSRIDYFKPSFEALLRAQVVFYSEMRTIFGDLTAQIGRPALSDEQRERENEGRLGELRALSIVADD